MVDNASENNNLNGVLAVFLGIDDSTELDLLGMILYYLYAIPFASAFSIPEGVSVKANPSHESIRLTVMSHLSKLFKSWLRYFLV